MHQDQGVSDPDPPGPARPANFAAVTCSRPGPVSAGIPVSASGAPVPGVGDPPGPALSQIAPRAGSGRAPTGHADVSVRLHAVIGARTLTMRLHDGDPLAADQDLRRIA